MQKEQNDPKTNQKEIEEVPAPEDEGWPDFAINPTAFNQKVVDFLEEHNAPAKATAIVQSSVVLFSYSTRQRRAESISMNLFKDKPSLEPIIKVWSSLKLMNGSESNSAAEEATSSSSYYAIAADKQGLICPSTNNTMYSSRIPTTNTYEDITSISTAAYECITNIFNGSETPFSSIGIKIAQQTIADANLLDTYVTQMMRDQTPANKALIKCLIATVGFHAVQQTLAQLVPSGIAVRPPVYIQTAAAFNLPARFLKNRLLTEDYKSRVQRAHHRLGLPPPMFEKDERPEQRGYHYQTEQRNRYARR